MANHLVTVETVKRSIGFHGQSRNKRVFDAVAGESKLIEQETDRFFIPRIQERVYDWPVENTRSPYYELPLDGDLIELISVSSQSNDTEPVVISLDDVFLGGNNNLPPYDKIMINRGATARFHSGDNWQRAIKVTGKWSFSANLRSAGSLVGAIDVDDEEITISNPTVIGIGDTLLLGTEQVFVTGRRNVLLATKTGDIVIGKSAMNSFLSTDGSVLFEDEVILIDGEKLLVESLAGNYVGVLRSFDGTTQAEHEAWSPIYSERLLTVERHVNGTTSATHADGIAIKRYAPEDDIVGLALAAVVVKLQQDEAGWVRKVGGGEGSWQASMKDYWDYRAKIIDFYTQMKTGAVG